MQRITANTLTLKPLYSLMVRPILTSFLLVFVRAWLGRPMAIFVMPPTLAGAVGPSVGVVLGSTTTATLRADQLRAAQGR